MKIRQGFVSNSSSSSFLIVKDFFEKIKTLDFNNFKLLDYNNCKIGKQKILNSLKHKIYRFKNEKIVNKKKIIKAALFSYFFLKYLELEDYVKYKNKLQFYFDEQINLVKKSPLQIYTENKPLFDNKTKQKILKLIKLNKKSEKKEKCLKNYFYKIDSIINNYVDKIYDDYKDFDLISYSDNDNFGCFMEHIFLPQIKERTDLIKLISNCH